MSRTADDLVRYHGKMMIVDDSVLHVYGFNFTSLDITKSRSFGVITKNKRLVHEASRLFVADFDRQPYIARLRPVHRQPGERARAAARLHQGRAQAAADLRPAGVATTRCCGDHRADQGRRRRRLIGKVEAKWNAEGREVSRAGGCTSAPSFATAAAPSSAARACAGSSSRSGARSAIIVTDEKVVKQMQDVFEQDWALTETGRKEAKKAEKAREGRKAASRAEARRRPRVSTLETVSRLWPDDGDSLTDDRILRRCARSPSSRRGARSRPCSTARTISASRTRGGCRRRV